MRPDALHALSCFVKVIVHGPEPCRRHHNDFPESVRLKQSYDPLFTTGGDRGFGSWFLGEIFGQYISPNSNLNVAMAHLKFSPIDTVEAGIIYYDFHFDQTAQFNDPRITSKNAAQEVDFYSVWSATEWLTLSGVLGFAVPGTGDARQTG
jgi:hypothetical protein